MPASSRPSFVRRLSLLGTMLMTALSGRRVGVDMFGNRYYRSWPLSGALPERRWVIYAGEPEASMVPPEWHGWLHHTLAEPLASRGLFPKPWMKPHQPNMTGVQERRQKGVERASYEPWTPPSLSER